MSDTSEKDINIKVIGEVDDVTMTISSSATLEDVINMVVDGHDLNLDDYCFAIFDGEENMENKEDVCPSIWGLGDISENIESGLVIVKVAK
eukprot:6465181-Amphidinium_carterae.1